ncbi:hypothetical protein PtB15_3B360 [Puccinia triticina]|nr:hypothetical protein PtB15_3B360 [Puccinia triticina]
MAIIFLRKEPVFSAIPICSDSSFNAGVQDSPLSNPSSPPSEPIKIRLRVIKALPVSNKPKYQSEEVDLLAPIIKADQKLPARRGRPPKLPPVVQTAQIGDLSNPDQDVHDTGPKHPASDCTLDKRPVKKYTAETKAKAKRGQPRKKAANQSNLVPAPLDNLD